MPPKNIAHVSYAIENTDLSSVSKIVIFHVLYVISVSFTFRGMDVVNGPSVGLTREWERGKSPSSSSQLLPTPAITLPRRSPATGHPRTRCTSSNPARPRRLSHCPSVSWRSVHSVPSHATALQIYWLRYTLDMTWPVPPTGGEEASAAELLELAPSRESIMVDWWSSSAATP
jgi:hypothetical protein